MASQDKSSSTVSTSMATILTSFLILALPVCGHSPHIVHVVHPLLSSCYGAKDQQHKVHFCTGTLRTSKLIQNAYHRLQLRLQYHSAMQVVP